MVVGGGDMAACYSGGSDGIKRKVRERGEMGW